MDAFSLKEIIIDLKKIGQTNEQIKAGFMAKGWPENQIQLLLDSMPANIPPVTNNKKEFIIGVIAFFLLLISTAAFFLVQNVGSNSHKINTNASTPKKISNIKSESITASVKTQQATSPGLNLIAYIVSQNDIEQVEIYDTTTHQNIAVPKELHDLEVSIYQIGPWSPNGTYLPILTHSDPRKSPRKMMMYFYDAIHNSVVKVAEKTDPDYTNDPWAFSAMSYANAWLDEETFAYSTEAKKDGILAKYINQNGEKGENYYPGKSVYHFERYSYKPGIGSLTDQLAGLYIDNATEPFKLPGLFLGMYGNEAISYKQPDAMDLYQYGSNGWELKPEIKEEADKIRNSSMSEPEKVVAAMELAKPKDPSKVYATDINSKKTKELFSQTPEWYMFSARFIPITDSVILHLTDHSTYPTKERVVTINLAESDRSQELITRDVQGLYELPGNQFLETGYSFSVTHDGQWVVLVLGDLIKTNTIDIVNVNTKERKTICSVGCKIPQVNTPVQFKEMFEK